MKKFRFFLVFILCLVTQAVLASNPEAFFRDWTRIDVSGPFNTDFPDLRYDAFIENRNLETRLDFSSGYRLTPLITLWSGFTWISPNQKPLPIVYRPWQQLTWELFKKDSPVLFQTRTRLEELKQEFQPQWALRLRERWRIAFPKKFPHKLTPVLYDEVFFNLNHPPWVSSRTINQNRFFAGVETPTWKQTSVEIGYINQYFFSAPPQRMEHILSVAFIIRLS